MTAIKLTKPSTVPTPSKIIPKPEQWLWQNPQALALVLKGIHQAAEGNVQKLGSLGQSANVKMDVLRCVN